MRIITPKVLQKIRLRMLMLCLVLALSSYPQWAESTISSVVLDPGRSYSQPGALSCSGIHEVYFNDALTAYISRSLNSANVAVRLTRSGTESPTLVQRAAKAKGTALFLSVHHDSVQKQFLINVPSGKKMHFCSEHAQGYSIFISRKNKYLQESIVVATKIAQSLNRSGFTPSLHHAENIPGERRELMIPALGIYFFDDLIVLKGAQTPAVLIEAAVIVNPEDEAQAATAGTMSIFAKAIAAAIIAQ